jgi:hypothetical protein
VFCVRVGDHPNALFRYVGYPDGAAPVVVADTLSCLAHARPEAGPDTPRSLDEATHRQAYDAWEVARHDVLERWTAATDPANMAPSVPRVLREAAALVRLHPPGAFTQTEIDRVLDALEAPHDQRHQRAIRDALRSSQDPAQQATAVVGCARFLGLKPAPAAQPLPPITRDDVHLVAWLAVVPG